MGYVRVKARIWNIENPDRKLEVELLADTGAIYTVLQVRVPSSAPFKQAFDQYNKVQFGRVPERPKGTDCKSVGSAFEGSNPSSTTTLNAGVAQLARASAFQAEGRRFESGFPLHF
jgi:hypothetical protein